MAVPPNSVIPFLNSSFEIKTEVTPDVHDVVFVSIEHLGDPGPLNQSVLKSIGYPQELPTKKQLDSGYFKTTHEKRTVYFIVTVSGSSKPEALLFRNVREAIEDLVSHGSGQDHRIYFPLMGTGWGKIPPHESLKFSITPLLELIAVPQIEWHFTVSIPSHFPSHEAHGQLSKLIQEWIPDSKAETKTEAQSQEPPRSEQAYESASEAPSQAKRSSEPKQKKAQTNQPGADLFSETGNSKVVVRRFTDEPVIGAKELSETLAEMIQNIHGNERGNLIGVFGQWGRGKTFLMNETWKVLEATDRFHRVDFHSWKYQDTKSSWAYLYEQFAQKYFEPFRGAQRAVSRFIVTFRLNVARRGTQKLWVELCLLLVSIASAVVSAMGDDCSSPLAWLFGTTTVAIAGAIWQGYVARKDSAFELISQYLGRKRFSEQLGIQAEIQKELTALLEQWLPVSPLQREQAKTHVTYDRILLVVDDLDRCSEDKIIAIIDALRVMLEEEAISERVIVLAAVDERRLQDAIRLKYENMVNSTDADKDRRMDELIQEYFDKLFLSGIKLGDLNKSERQEVFKTVADLGQSEEEKQKPPESEETKQDEDKTAAGEQEAEKGGNSVRSTVNGSDNAPGKGTQALLDIDTRSDGSPQGQQEDKPGPTDPEINEAEAERLSAVIEDFIGATPRQIRIFYFRYLLARKLLKKRLLQDLGMFESDGDTKVPNGDAMVALPDVLMHFQLGQHDPRHGEGFTFKTIEELLMEIAGKESETISIQLPHVSEGSGLQRSKQVTLKKPVFTEMLQIARIVMAY